MIDDVEEEEDYLGEVFELLMEDIVENVFLNLLVNFEDFVDENFEFVLFFDFEVEEVNIVVL